MCSIVPWEGALSGWLYLVEVLWMRWPTRADLDLFLTPLLTMVLPHDGGKCYGFVFYNGCNTDFLPGASIAELLADGFRPWGH